ncbi:MAG: C4-dicarboxylate transporter DcuC, partial [Bacteroidales bacterium]|nr:C4-dicarboxylate transporter DcuC [Bacteroidales bacterium]
YYFSNRYFDRKDIEAGKEIFAKPAEANGKPDVPLLFAVLPMLPLVLLVVFSQYVGLFDIHLSTTAAMLFSLVVSVLLIAIHQRNFKKVMGLLDSFWKGMGSVFTTVVTLIVAAEIFAGGLNSLGFIDSLVSGSTHIGLSGMMITIVMSVLIFLAAMLTGSGNAAFFSFGPLIPDVAVKLGLTSWEMILPMQLSASMGRATSPIAGVIVAIAGVAGVSPVDVAKRNLLPLAGGLVFLQIFHSLIN